jgi:hypothetical protein
MSEMEHFEGLEGELLFEDNSGFHDDEGNHVELEALPPEPDGSEDSQGFVWLKQLGVVDSSEVMVAIDEITDNYFTNVEGNLIWLMRQGRRPVEISRILRIPECEVVRLRRNCFRKIRVVYTYDYFYDKQAFLIHAAELLRLNEKQFRILKMFFNYQGLRPIAEAIGTRPSNIHRSLESIKTRLDNLLPEDSEYRPFLRCFQEFKYLHLNTAERPSA